MRAEEKMGSRLRGNKKREETTLVALTGFGFKDRIP